MSSCHCEAQNHADFLAQSPLSRSCRAVPLAKQVSISVYIGLFGNAITVSQGIAFAQSEAMGAAMAMATETVCAGETESNRRPSGASPF